MRRVIDGFIDGLVYAGLVGIGFAFIEIIGYYSSSYLGSADMKVAGAAGVTATFVMRGIFSPFAHPGFTSAFGIGLGLAVSTLARRNIVLRAFVVLVGFATSMSLHALWNGSLAFGGGQAFLLTYVVLFVALLPSMPLQALLRQHCQITATDPPEVIRTQVARRLQAAGIPPGERLAYMLRLLGVQDGIDGLTTLRPATLRPAARGASRPPRRSPPTRSPSPKPAAAPAAHRARGRPPPPTSRALADPGRPRRAPPPRPAGRSRRRPPPARPAGSRGR